LSTLTLEDEEICFDDENEFGENDQLLKCLVGDFPYIPSQDQDLYFILMMEMIIDLCFFKKKIFYFHNILVFYLS
jgi:hypothetical protein